MKQIIHIPSEKINNTHNLDNPDYHQNIINLLKSNFHFPISGGSGKSIDDPITIKLTPGNDYVGIEYKLLRCLGIILGYEWNCIEQKLSFPNGKKIDQLKIEIIQRNSDQNIVVDYFFDITECFNRFERDVSDYLRENATPCQNKKNKNDSFNFYPGVSN